MARWCELGDSKKTWANKDFADDTQNNEFRNCTKKWKERPRADSRDAKIWFNDGLSALINDEQG